MTVIEYVTEEVRRQGHDTEVLDGIERVGWMLDGWRSALLWNATKDKPDVFDAIDLGQRVEPVKNAGGIRQCGVRVGMRTCPHPKDLTDLLKRLWQHRDAMTPMEFYKEFEEIHPFVDGNGRTGKILLNWLNGTLLDPIFPPADLFGESILNP